MINHRNWYLLLIISLGLLGCHTLIQRRLTNQVELLNQQAEQERQANLRQYLARQTDARKLISLAKRLAHSEIQLVQLAIERAYQLNPNSRDIALLASYSQPDLKKQVQILDPLYPLK